MNHPRTPVEVIEAFAARVGSGDVEGAVALYHADAVFQPAPDGAPVRGVEAIRAAVEQFAALSPTLTGDVVKVLEAGPTALVLNRWKLEGTAPDGQPVAMSGTSADVLRRGGDGAWRIAVDDPWGAG